MARNAFSSTTTAGQLDRVREAIGLARQAAEQTPDRVPFRRTLHRLEFPHRFKRGQRLNAGTIRGSTTMCGVAASITAESMSQQGTLAATRRRMRRGTQRAVPAHLASGAAAARRARGDANRSAACETCPLIDTAA
jgi:hypothetical protein